MKNQTSSRKNLCRTCSLKIYWLRERKGKRMRHFKGLYIHFVLSAPFCLAFLNLYQTMKFWIVPNRKDLQRNNKKIAKVMISISDLVENIVGKGENAGYQHFLLSHNVIISFLF